MDDQWWKVVLESEELSADGYELDVIIGSLTMERWEIKLDPKTGMLDLEGLRRRELTEFYQKGRLQCW